MDIKSYNLNQNIIDYLESKKINTFLPVQQKTIPNLIKNKDLFVESPTGTGKTLAFLIPILNNLNFDKKETQAIIIAPTRELSMQINDVLNEIKKFFDKKIFSTLAIGGKDFEDQQRKIKNGTHIIIGTIDRISSLREKTKHNLNELSYLIIDEIDMILSFGFFNEISDLIKKISNEVVFGFFSATFPIEIQNFLKNNLNKNINNIIIKHKNDEELVSYLIKAFDNNKEKTLLKLINSDIFNPYFCLIFSKTNKEVEKIYSLMIDKGIKNVSKFTSDLSQRNRNKILKQIKNSELIYLVTTDLMARGMDFIGVTHIINFSLPVDLIYYKHRIGRTNRNQVKGNIYDIYIDGEERRYSEIKKKNSNIEFKKTKI